MAPDVPSSEPDLLVVYGTLRSGTGWRERLGIDALVESIGACRLAGSLYALGWYPGLVLDGAAPVQAEVLRLLDPAALIAVDRFEGYDPSRPEAGEYRREELDVDGHGPAWIYVLPAVPPGATVIASGDWLAHVGLAQVRPAAAAVREGRRVREWRSGDGSEGGRA